MPDEITPPGGSGASTPDAPEVLTVTGAAAAPVETVSRYGSPTAIEMALSGVLTARIRAGAADALESITLVDAGATLSFVELVIPASVDTIVFSDGCAAGDYVDQIIAALPDRSGADDGEYTDTETILTAGQISALEAKGFTEAA
ncbi:MAG: hypothetical protein ACQKBU_04490 [Verrucomicrobiales bacterium]